MSHNIVQMDGQTYCLIAPEDLETLEQENASLKARLAELTSDGAVDEAVAMLRSLSTLPNSVVCFKSMLRAAIAAARDATEGK